MSKFELNPTVNESENSILLKLRISEKYPIAQRVKELAQRLCDASEYEKDVKHHSFMNIWTPNSEIYQN